MISRPFLAAAFALALLSPAAAQTAAQPVIPGYITINGCASANQTPCFVAFSGSSSLKITAAAVVKATSGRLVRVSVVVAGSTAGSCNDAATTGAATTANQILAIPTTITAGTVVYLDFPTTNGIVCTPGTGGQLAVSFD